MAWTVHLYGGPWDGREVAVPDLRDLVVAEAIWAPMNEQGARPTPGVTYRTGRYVRLGLADPNAGTAVMAWADWDTEQG